MLKESTIHELLDLVPHIQKRALQEEILNVATLAADDLEANPEEKEKPHAEDKAKSKYPLYNSELHPGLASLRNIHRSLKGSNKEEFFFKTKDSDLKQATDLYKKYIAWFAHMRTNKDWHDYGMFQNQVEEILNTIKDFQTGIQAATKAQDPKASVKFDATAKEFMQDTWIKNPPVDVGIEAILRSGLSNYTQKLVGFVKKESK
jgi:hypothetical protein